MTISTERLRELINNHVAYSDMTEEEIGAVVEYNAEVRAQQIQNESMRAELLKTMQAMQDAADAQVEAARAAFEAVTRRD